MARLYPILFNKITPLTSLTVINCDIIGGVKKDNNVNMLNFDEQ